jgi:hypothetical protein
MSDLLLRDACEHAGATPSCPCGEFEWRGLNEKWLAFGVGRDGPVWGLGRVDRRPYVAVVFSPPFAEWWKGVRRWKARRTIGGTWEGESLLSENQP